MIHGLVSSFLGGSARASSIRILAVDDDPNEFALLEDGFANCGAVVDLLSVTSGPMALAELMLIAPDSRPHLALIDINMPLVSGFELAKQLVREGIPTILMSCQVDDQRLGRAHALGVLDLLAKPLDAQGYVAFAARVLHTAQFR